MRRCILLAAGLLSAAATAWAQDPGKEATDRYGDPLPAGAVARLGTVRLRHTGWVLDAAFSANGRVLASFGGDRRLRLWDTADGRELQSTTLEQLLAYSTFT